MNRRPDPPLFVSVLGPTAVGKSELAMILAERLDTAILSADSMQVYRGLDIGTAKPSNEDQARVPHHLIDVADPQAAFSVCDYLELAFPILEEHWEAHKPLVICGGTGLYLKALSEGLAAGPPPDYEFRSALEARTEREGTEPLYREFLATDPVAAGKVHPNDRKRIIRALEIYHQTGLTKTQFEAEQCPPPWHKAFRWSGLQRSWEDLDNRIDSRVERMIERGLEGEVAKLLAEGLSRTNTALQALGYKEMADHLLGSASLEETLELIKQRTRRFARRQMTWFRAMTGVEWNRLSPFPNEDTSSYSTLADAMLKSLV